MFATAVEDEDDEEEDDEPQRAIAQVWGSSSISLPNLLISTGPSTRGPDRGFIHGVEPAFFLSASSSSADSITPASVSFHALVFALNGSTLGAARLRSARLATLRLAPFADAEPSDGSISMPIAPPILIVLSSLVFRLSFITSFSLSGSYSITSAHTLSPPADD